jgi:hypothetical protein
MFARLSFIKMCSSAREILQAARRTLGPSAVKKAEPCSGTRSSHLVPVHDCLRTLGHEIS